MGLGYPRASLETVDKTEISASFRNLTLVPRSFSLQCSQIEVIRDLMPIMNLLTLIELGKAKQSLNRPGEVLKLPGGSGSKISGQLAHEGGKVVSLTHRPALLSGNIPGTHFC